MITATPVGPAWREMNRRRYDPDKLLVELGIGHPPVDVFSIPAAIGARLHFVNDPSWDGAVESTDDGEADIYVNARQAIVRQRFTVAHELGHLLMHKPGQAFRDIWATLGTNPLERQANKFAASLLMPSWMVRAIAEGNEVGELSKIFSVSTEAMTYRLKNLGYRIT